MVVERNNCSTPFIHALMQACENGLPMCGFVTTIHMDLSGAYAYLPYGLMKAKVVAYDFDQLNLKLICS